ncbi:multiple epidermal growth factor-like domains protein 10 [Caerostris darwini]|uniref:Multiple epidermal growth factor-like domains protein 10 n=1 Tax=Caerostris darwini TaxID=1538125 RepID=A0AAV4U9H4_9ARAC|nr:multiple epidermal growth factor-like domains protein 10 [Caerostris darwini]
MGLSILDNKIFQISGLLTAVTVVGVIVLIIGCIMCKRKRKNTRLELFALSEKKHNFSVKSECSNKVEESNCDEENHGNVYEEMNRPDFQIYENVELKRNSPFSHFEFKFPESIPPDAVYENTEDCRRKLVTAEDIKEAHSAFYDKPKSNPVRVNLQDNLNIYENATYDLHVENTYVNTCANFAEKM